MTDHHSSTPPHCSDDERGRLAIPGDSQRPRLVWAPIQPAGRLSPALASIVLNTYTVTGDVVLDVDDDISFAEVALRTGRRHHALAGAEHLAALGHAAGYIDLILLRWPRPAAHPHWLLRACRALLHTSGHLAIAVATDPSRRIAALSAISGAALTAGLHTIDHLAVLAPGRQPGAAVTSEQRRPSGDRRRPRPATEDQTTTPSSLVHTDVLVLASESTSDE